MAGFDEYVVPWELVPDRMLHPAGIYELRVESLTRSATADGRLMYAGVFRTTGNPPEVPAELPHYENYTIGQTLEAKGTMDDPDAEREETIKSSVGLRLMKQLFNKCGLDMQQTIGALCQDIVNRTFLAQVIVKKDTRPDSPYAGQERNNIAAYYALGERETGLTGIAAPTRAPAPAAPGGRPAAHQAPAKPAAPVRPTAPARVPAPPARQAAAPAARPAPAQAAVASAPAGGNARRPGASFACPLCGLKNMTRVEFQAHASECQGAAEE